jgi:basic amino acid/polyamine antiporter, APA family
VNAPIRRLGITITAAIVIANMIGVGVFTSTGFQANSLHDPKTILLAWVVGGVLALCGAAAYAELGSMLPRAGGEYVYLREAYHPAVGFMSGWVSLTAGFSAPIAAAALAFATYLAVLFPPLHDPWVGRSIAIAMVVLITGLHAFDTKIGGSVQAAFTIGKVLLIVLFILGGLLVGEGSWSNLSTQAGGFDNVTTTAFATSLMYVSFAYSGWNAAAYIANEVEQPAKNLPRALILGTGIVMVLYLLLNLVFLYAVPSTVLAGPADDFKPVIEVGDVAAQSLFGPSAGQLVSAVIALALVSSVSAMIMAGPRVYAAMAADRALPRLLGHHNKRGVPVPAVITQGTLAIAFVLVGDLGKLIRFVGFTLAIFAALTVGAVFVMRNRGHRAAYRTFGYPVTPVLFIALSAWIAYSQIRANPFESLYVALVLGAGAVAYMFMTKGKEPLPDESLPEGMSAGVPIEATARPRE